MKHAVVDARVVPEGRLDVLSRLEVSKLLDTSRGGLHELFRNCSLAVLNCGNEVDDGKELLERYRSFDIRVESEERGIQLEVKGAPASAFVDGEMIKGIGEHLFAVLRDVVYVSDEATRPSTWSPRPALPTRCFTSCAMPAFCTRSPTRSWWCAGAGIPSIVPNTTTPN